jgi:hypothetical protein
MFFAVCPLDATTDAPSLLHTRNAEREGELTSPTNKFVGFFGFFCKLAAKA